MNSGKVALGVLAGLAAGAIAGILLAPAKGSKTRRRIIKKGEDLYGSSKDKIDELIDVVIEKFESIKDDVSEYAERVKEDVADFAEKKIPKTEEAGKAQK
ncbi:MAG: YtxH domain-containing protein [Bacteroidales bacterium]|nr:YtxH domain-containing protein [Tenuifilaceae bacterium]